MTTASATSTTSSRPAPAPSEWKFDAIMWANRSEMLFYKGTMESGIFVSVVGDEITAGTYDGAFPHITDALFVVKRTLKCATAEEAQNRTLTKAPLLFAFLFGTSAGSR